MYLVLDLETSCEEKHGRKGSPFFNRILCIGLKYQGIEAKGLNQDYMPKGWLDKVNVLIGHNIKYDLLYLWKNEELQNAFKRGLRIWDTQLCEYMLSGQQHKYPALRDIAVRKYGCKNRVKHIEQGFEQGLDTTQIDIKLLLEDVTNDVLDTESVAITQLKLTKKEEMYTLVCAQMEGLLATTEMEFNGMYVNKDILFLNKLDLQEELHKNKVSLNTIVRLYWPENIEFNSASPQQLSTLLFGGKLKHKIAEEIGTFKTGQRKNQTRYKIKEIDVLIEGCNLPDKYKIKGAKEGVYSTDESVLKIVANAYKEGTGKKFDASCIAQILLKIRELNKQIDTYYSSTETHIHEFDSCVHTQLCHCGYERSEGNFGGATSTGRLSSRAPNMQNQPKASVSKVKEHFTSRWREGSIIELDYKQLELVVFAYLTQDQGLIKAIIEGIDIHKESASSALNKPLEEVTDLERSNAKAVNFGLIYGSGSFSMASRNGLEQEFCQTFIDTFFKKYPQTKQWQDNLVKKVYSTRIRLSPEELTKKGIPISIGHIKSVTGRKYIFKTTDSPKYLIEKGIATSFNPPDIKNYLVQGLATADIVLIMLGRLWRKLAIYNREKYLLVNTVHDSVIFDFKIHCKKDVDMIRYQLEDVKSMMKELFIVDFNVPIQIDVKYGKSWMLC